MDNKIKALKNRTKELFQSFCGKGDNTAKMNGENYNHIAGTEKIKASPSSLLDKFFDGKLSSLQDGQDNRFSKVCKAFDLDPNKELSNEQEANTYIAMMNIERDI